MTDKKLSALECADPQEAVASARQAGLGAEHPPCALLHPRGLLPADQPAPAAEDESADPVGDGHSDADLARQLGPSEDTPPPEAGGAAPS